MSDSTSFPVSLPQDSSDIRPLPEIIAEQRNFPLAYHDHEDGKRYYAVQDWIAGVGQAAEPRVFLAMIKRRLKKAKIELFTQGKQLSYHASNGRTYHMNHADAETLYRITHRCDATTALRHK